METASININEEGKNNFKLRHFQYPANQQKQFKYFTQFDKKQ